MSHFNEDAARRDRQLDQTLDHARRLSERPAGDRYAPEWWAQAERIGDLTALAASTLARSRRN